MKILARRRLGKGRSLCGSCSIRRSKFVVWVVVQVQSLVERNQVEEPANNVFHFHEMKPILMLVDTVLQNVSVVHVCEACVALDHSVWAELGHVLNLGHVSKLCVVGSLTRGHGWIIYGIWHRTCYSIFLHIEICTCLVVPFFVFLLHL